MKKESSALVVGGGLIGGSIAWELAERGVSVTLLDKGSFGGEASTAAAGMLGAHVETHADGPFFDLCRRSLQLYRDWTERIAGRSGLNPQYEAEGIVRIAYTEEDEAELRSRLPWIGDYSWLETDDLRHLEPGIGGEPRGGLFFSGDHRVHPVKLAEAMRAGLERLGCRVLENTPVLGLVTSGGRATGVRTGEGLLYADSVILAGGAWGLLPEELQELVPLFPVKGQCYSVRPNGRTASRTLFTKGCYLVPRLDGTVTIGATQLEAGFDKRPTVEALAALHASAVRLQPALAEAEFLRTWTGLRPGTPDGLPYMGALPGLDQVYVATGHFRNGVLLAPVTGRLMAGLLLGDPAAAAELEPYSPERNRPAVSTGP